jgi:hypothetical protein
VLVRFYVDDELTNAETELLSLIARDGNWGKEVATQRERLCVHLDNGAFYMVQKIANAQVATSANKPHLRWKVIFYHQFPLLSEVARRVLIMGS